MHGKPRPSAVTSQPTYDRRKRWRLAAGHRVEYPHVGRRMVSYTANISSGGMYLRSVGTLRQGDEALFAIALESKAPLFEVSGRVVACDSSRTGARIGFTQCNEATTKRLHDYVDRYHLARLVDAVSTRRPSATKVIDLAGVYAERGAFDDAIEVLHHGVVTNPDAGEIYERALPFVLERMLRAPNNEPNAGIVEKFRHLLAQGADHRASVSLLEGLGSGLQQLERNVDRAEAARRARELRRAVALSVAQRQKELELDFEQRLHEERQALANQLAQYRAKLEDARAALMAEKNAVARERNRLEVELRRALTDAETDRVRLRACMKELDELRTVMNRQRTAYAPPSENPGSPSAKPSRNREALFENITSAAFDKAVDGWPRAKPTAFGREATAG